MLGASKRGRPAPLTISCGGSEGMAENRIPAEGCSRGAAILGSNITAATLVMSAVISGLPVLAQSENKPIFRANVDMVVLTFGVTNEKDKYVGGLTPNDLRILEDGIPQKIATLSEGSQPAIRLPESPGGSPGTNVFLLFDTSNRMYQTYAYACDAIAGFVRQLDPGDSIALYTFSRNLWRALPLTQDHNQTRVGLSSAVAGAETALYNAVLLTLRDADRVPGRKAVVVFSNGPDTASIISPDDVGAVAANAGIPIYVISTQEAGKDRVTSKAFEFLTTHTGGKLYWARNWQKQAEAFASIHQDIGSSYTVSYYPAPNSNAGFRRIQVEVLSKAGKKYHVRARPGYDAGTHSR
jgi:Ca-activated chloride channel family protein